MKLRNRLLAGAAAGAMLVSGSALAALNADKLHLALTSLRLALVKIGVANAMLSNPTPPANNAEAHVGAPAQMSSNEISAIAVGPGGVITVHLTPVVGVADGIILLEPRIATGADGKPGVQYTCISPNMPDIAGVAPECSYHAAGK